MSGFLGAAWWFIVTLGVLVSFHEFGHFWVARRCGVKVLRFSIGFGRALWSRTAADGTRYQLAMIPLGGYVQFLDERESEVAPADRDRAFNRQPVWKRMLIVLAGPMANLLLCLLLFWLVFMIGMDGISPVIGSPSGLTAQAGLVEGDRIIQVGNSVTPTWNQALTPLALAEIDRKPLQITVQKADGSSAVHTLALDRLPPGFDQANPLGSIGMTPAMDSPVVGRVSAGSPAEGKLRTGDEIRRIGGQPVTRFTDIGPALQKAAAGGGAVDVELLRNSELTRVSIVPHRVRARDGSAVWQFGIGNSPKLTRLRFGPVPAFRAALAEIGKQSREMLGFIGRLATGKASSKNLSGVVGIAQVAQAEANIGASALLAFMASLSLTLCIMNLLPIPVLDGGHLLYYLIELVSGRPVGERVLIVGQYAGLALLAGLICLAFFNDIVRTIS